MFFCYSKQIYKLISNTRNAFKRSKYHKSYQIYYKFLSQEIKRKIETFQSKKIDNQ